MDKYTVIPYGMNLLRLFKVTRKIIKHGLDGSNYMCMEKVFNNMVPELEMCFVYNLGIARWYMDIFCT